MWHYGEIVALDVRWFETTRSSRSQLVSTSNRKPSSVVMKIDPKRADYIARRCDTLSNDQLMNCERQLSLSWELFWSKQWFTLLSIQEWNCVRLIPMSWDPNSWDNNEATCGFFDFIPKIESNAQGITILPTFLFNSRSNFRICITSFASQAIWDFSWSITLSSSTLGSGWPLLEQCW